MKRILLLTLICFFALGLSGENLKRTVILIEGETSVGQDMFIRGGIDHDYASSELSKNCTTTNYECSIPITHRNLKNSTTAPWKNGDTFLDWYGSESGQDDASLGTPLDWTINEWPADWGTKRLYDVDGYGVFDLNKYGAHYWAMDVDMDCDATVDGWFEFKSFISNGPGWEGDISQSGTPYASGNHFAKCGKINVFKRNQTEPVEMVDFAKELVLEVEQIDTEVPSVTLTWTDLGRRHQSTTIYRSLTKDGEYESIGVAYHYQYTVTSYVDTTVEAGVKYFYKVRSTVSGNPYGGELTEFSNVVEAYIGEQEGTVSVTMLNDSFENGTLVSNPLNKMQIYLDDNGGFGSSNLVGETANNNPVTFTAEAGSHWVTYFKNTSGSSSLAILLSREHRAVEVTEGATSEVVIHVAANFFKLAVNASTNYGESLYITGESDYLGNWETAKKLTYNNGMWLISGFFPKNANYKIIKANSSDDTISTTGAIWENGDNNKVTENQPKLNPTTIYPNF